ncbi:disease resistance protein [Glycine max]|uniref:Disease resistance protein n=1 Tax=Glycine max TaxID=3847 RepID=C6ZS21_SOYBN|nr:disease resistance protein [Glycine max]ACM89615.1 disease resistance protein [Glycine max]|eukprot:NP_001235618.1 disease resistance protein [Glycine max]
MAETAVSLAGQHALPKILEAVKMLRDLPNEVRDITDELESFQDFINDADKVAEAEEDDGRRHRIKERVMRLREAAFRMEDVIDEYNISCEDKQPDDPRCAALQCEAVDFIKTQILRLQSAYKIQDVKLLVRAERDGFQRHFPLEKRSTSSRGNQDVTWQTLRRAPLFIEEDEVVGLDNDRATLKYWLTNGREQRTVISVVGIAGVGKTTLAKQVYDQVRNNFECHALITVSQSFSAVGLLTHMLNELCKEKNEDPPKDVSTIESLTKEVRNRLRNKRYVVLFDDVWNETFWDHIESAVIDNKNGSRILITTRDEKVAEYCRKSSFVEVHNLEKPLTEEESLKLFCKKAFQYSSDGDCPEELKDISLEIVRKCKDLPLAIVAIGGLLSQKDESAPEWGQFSRDLSLDLERNSELNSITKILGLSYDDLPINLRSCLLYFGMYPEDYEVKSDRLIRQWITEGFVKHETGKSLEEVGQPYLSGLVHRSLVQVSSLRIDGKVKRCRVHDLIHDMILRKVKDTGFCQYIDGRDQSVSSNIVRRLTIATHDFSGSTRSSPIRSILIMTGKDENLSQDLVNKFPTNYMLLKVLDFEGSAFSYVPENLGNLCHLKYLSFRYTWIASLPKSIGKLLNLETLDIRGTGVSEMPEEISKLKKLRHLLAYSRCSIQWKDIGGMTSLQEIPPVIIDDDGVVIREVGKLKQLRELSVNDFEGKHKETLCSLINEMPLLEKLLIDAADWSEVIDLYITSPMSTLRKLVLFGKLTRFPNWISQFPNLVQLRLRGSRLTNDALQSLNNMPRLLFLVLRDNAYEGETLHFQRGWFQRLKQLFLQSLDKLKSILIDRGALCSVEEIVLRDLSQLKTVPSGIQHLEKLKDLYIDDMPTEFEQRIAPDGGEDHWIIQDVPHVRIWSEDAEEPLHIFGRSHH